jgi:hypothetical protein
MLLFNLNFTHVSEINDFGENEAKSETAKGAK